MEFSDHLRSSIAYVAGQNRSLLDQIVKAHVSDEPAQAFADKLLAHLKLAGFEIDEAGQCLRKRPPVSPHGRGSGA